MHIKSIRIKSFKRFTDLTVEDLPATAKLVIVTGSNGSGKSGLIESLNFTRRSSSFGYRNDPSYYNKVGDNGSPSDSNQVEVKFHEVDVSGDGWKKAIWVRSAYRHQADFQNESIRRMEPSLESPGHDRLITTEELVSENYNRLASNSLEALYNTENDPMQVARLRETIIGPLQAALSGIFEDLQLYNLVNPMSQGTFFFSKGNAKGFPFKNLSAGDRAASTCCWIWWLGSRSLMTQCSVSMSPNSISAARFKPVY